MRSLAFLRYPHKTADHEISSHDQCSDASFSLPIRIFPSKDPHPKSGFSPTNLNLSSDSQQTEDQRSRSFFLDVVVQVIARMENPSRDRSA